MELLIPGLILVALMVYASTRIKKSAEAAFEPETITGDGFTLEKPEGFLSVVGGNNSLEFEAYSREFGGTGSEDIRQAVVEVRRSNGTENDIETGGETISEEHQVIDGRKYTITERTRSEKGTVLREIKKSAEVNGLGLELKIVKLDETNEDMARKIDMMLSSFRVVG